jgi:hypothetical protein
MTDQFKYGAIFTTNPDAPTVPVLDRDRLAVLFTAKTEAREKWIAADMAKTNEDRFFSAIQYDSNVAPLTTNLQQLEEIGVSIPPTNLIETLDEAEVARLLWDIIYGLAALGIYLSGTNGYDDRTMLIRLRSSVLVDAVRDIPPSADMSEFIDLSSPDDGNHDRDSLLPRPHRAPTLGNGIPMIVEPIDLADDMN